MPGTRFRALLGLGCFLCVQGLGAREARAADKVKVEGFELLGSVGYGAAVTEIGEDEQNPFGAFIGADFGYTWRFGFRLGLELTYGFAREVTRKSLLPNGIDVNEKVRTASGAVSVGYDVVLSQFRLRGSLDLGAMPVFAAGTATAVVLVAPGVAAFWQHGAFQVGLAPKFIVQTNSDTPGVTAQLKAGARF